MDIRSPDSRSHLAAPGHPSLASAIAFPLREGAGNAGRQAAPGGERIYSTLGRLSLAKAGSLSSAARILHVGGNAWKEIIALADGDRPANRVTKVGRVLIRDLAKYQRNECGRWRAKR